MAHTVTNPKDKRPIKKKTGAKPLKKQQNSISSKKYKDIAPEDKAIMELIGKKIRELRNSRDISYIKMAEAVGLSRNNYSLMELGKIYFKMSSLLRILKYYNINIVDFFKSLDHRED